MEGVIMPITQREATKIVDVSQEYLPLERLKELFVRLDEEVGKKSEDASLRECLAMMRLLVDPPIPPAPYWLWTAWYVLVVVHYVLVLGVGLSFILLPFLASWYIALPLMTFIVFFSSTRVECQLTNLENVMRKRLGLRRIGGFVGHYMVKPLRRLGRLRSK